MDITKFNFHQELDSIVESINSCDFMAIDGEFTGLDVQGGNYVQAPFDTPEERYHKLRNNTTDFLLIQFGLCTFHADKQKQRYEARPYNFYVFPRPHDRNSPDRRFFCQSSSIEFLANHGFDFNKLFREGIPYLMPEAEETLRAQLTLRHEEANKVTSPAVTSKMTVPEEQKPFIAGVMDDISNYLESEEQKPLALPSYNSFQRRLLYQSIQEKFPDLYVETLTGEYKERYMSISRLKGKDDRLKKEQEKQAKQRLELDLQVGFSRVIQTMSQSGKLVVGHNMLLDVIHSVNQFHSALPSELDGFKAVVKKVYPRLLDTKLMASTHPFKEHILSTSLDEVRQTVKHAPFEKVNVDLAEGFERYSDSGSLHEAGYDAYITGCCFAHMTRFLGKFRDPVDDFLLPTSAVVEPFVNKLFLMRIHDIPYMNLNGPDLQVSRDHVFHVTFSGEWKATDLFTLFNPYGNIQISWLSDTTAYVGLHRRENAKKALKALSKDTSSFQVVSYASYQRSKSYKWSTPKSETPQATCKRKPDDDTPECTPSKTIKMANSLLSPGNLKPPNESKPSKNSKNNSQDDSPPPVRSNGTGSPASLDEDTKMKQSADKMFEEADSW